MGPYSRGTSHTTGAFFDLFYQYPILMGLFILAASGIGLWLWSKNRNSTKSNH